MANFYEIDVHAVRNNGTRLHTAAQPVRTAVSKLLARYDAAAPVVHDKTISAALMRYRDRYQRSHLSIAGKIERIAAGEVGAANAVDDSQRESASVQGQSLKSVEALGMTLSRPLNPN